jgi:EamA-like transporter family.
MTAFNPLNIPQGFSNLIKLAVRIFFNPYIFTGMIAYLLSTVLWLYALSKTELSYAYPFTTLTFILVMIASFFLFSETLTVNKVIGGVIICAGVLIISLK